jgi:short-subunit dehydrogenase
VSRLVLITGASSGIGQALAAHALRAGDRVVLVARRTALLQNWAARQPAEAAGRIVIHGADVRDLRAMADLGRACIESHGVPDVVIANAGLSVGIDSADFADLQVLKDTLEINVLGMAATFHPFIEAMRQRRAGTLVGIGSVAAIRGLPGHGAYCASKAAVVSYCESLRGECRPFGVRVLTLSPGYVDTPLTQGNPYPMPFLMSAEAFAQAAWRAIEEGASYRVIPWPMALVAKLLRLLPNALFDRLFAGRPRKPRQQR